MKKINIIVFVILNITTGVFAGGSLTPPAGTPAPTMKTLDEIDQSVSNTTATVKIAEPRTPLVAGESGVYINANGTISITQSGSYYLTSNLTVSSLNGIVINTNGVTLDLNGFTIRTSSAIASGSGILIQGSNISICNGHIVSGTVYHSGASGNQYTGPGFQNGIYAIDTYSNIRICDVFVSGCKFSGIDIKSKASLVESCTVKTVGATGINAGVVNNCSATTCGGMAIYGIQITDCRGVSTGSYGIFSNGTVANSYGYSATDDGIHSNETIINSYGGTSGTAAFADGILAGSSVQNSHGYSAGGNGIQSYGTVANSYGYSRKGDGIQSRIASYSYGRSNGPASWADGVESTIAIGCIAEGGENITHKYLMP